MTIIVSFHRSGYRDFKTYYIQHVTQVWKSAFPKLVSYERFVTLQKTTLIPLIAYLNTRKGNCTGINFIDSASLAVCHNMRISRHRTFNGLANRGKSTMGWFYGFKLHLVVNEVGDLLAFHVTSGNVDDREPVEKMCNALMGKLFGDKGYISKRLFRKLWNQGLQLITNIRKNMKQKLVPIADKLMLRKRFLIETINDQLKKISQIEHSRHRSVGNFMVNLVAGLVAYTWQENKPSINWSRNQQKLMANIVA